jgi:hypothetical protein
MSRDFARFNLNHVLTRAERERSNLWQRSRKLTGLYCQMMRAGGYTSNADYQKSCGGKRSENASKNPARNEGEYQKLSVRYRDELRNFEADLPRLRAYEPVIREAIAQGKGLSGAEEGAAASPVGLRYFCSNRMNLRGQGGAGFRTVHEAYEGAYLGVAASVDGILLHTKAFEKHRLQPQGWIQDPSVCPDEFPVNITRARVERAVTQALEQTAIAAREKGNQDSENLLPHEGKVALPIEDGHWIQLGFLSELPQQALADLRPEL